MEGTCVALRPIQYGPSFPADMVDLHQVFEMRNEQNDEALLRLRFVAPLAPKTPLVQCGRCGKKFTDGFSLNRHGQLRHEPQREPQIVDDHLGKIDTDDPSQLEARARQLQREMRTMVPADGMHAPNPEAEAMSAEDKLLNEVGPIDWTKTKAAVQANDVKVPEVSTAPAKPRARKRAGKRGA